METYITHEQEINGNKYEFELCVGYDITSDSSDGHSWLIPTNERIELACSEAVIMDDIYGTEVDVEPLLQHIDTNAVFSQIEIEL